MSSIWLWLAGVLRAIRSFFSSSSRPSKRVVRHGYRYGSKKAVRLAANDNGRPLTVKVVGFGPGGSTYRVRRPKHRATFIVPASRLQPRDCDIVAARQA